MTAPYTERLGRITLQPDQGLAFVPGKTEGIPINEKEAVVLRLLSRDATTPSLIVSARDRGIILETKETRNLLSSLVHKLGPDVIRQPFRGHYMLVPEEKK